MEFVKLFKLWLEFVKLFELWLEFVKLFELWLEFVKLFVLWILLVLIKLFVLYETLLINYFWWSNYDAFKVFFLPWLNCEENTYLDNI